MHPAPSLGAPAGRKGGAWAGPAAAGITTKAGVSLGAQFSRIISYCVLSTTEGDPRMRTTQQFSITLPHDMAEAVEGKIKSGHYASVSEVVRDGVRALLERDAAVERWLREEVVAGHQEYLADPSKGVPADAILGRIKARRASRKKQ